jgi:hypothetical protein
MVDNAVRLLRNGAFLAADRARPEAWTQAYTTVTYGGPTDTWGTTWSAAELNALALSAAIQTSFIGTAGNNTAFVDAVRVTVHYCD